MNVLFCNEGFIIDGVASYNLYLSACLSQAGDNVAIIGRWSGRKGFQKRHRRFGVRVIQCPSLTADNPWLVSQAKRFQPDIVITDARRSFRLSQRIQEKTGAKVVTIFHDPPQYDRSRERGIQSLISGSDAWVTAEKTIFKELQKISPDLPVCYIQRPITGVIDPTPLPPRDPFRLLCLGRLSGWKSPGLRIIVEKAVELKETIPSLEITLVGGGGRYLSFWWEAKKANTLAGKRFVRVLGTKTNPQPWIDQATAVCAGATSAAEAILSCRPVLAFSGFWIGLITEQNLSYALSTHFAERQGDFYVRDKPHVVLEGLIDLYRQWQDGHMEAQVNTLREKLAPDFDSIAVAHQFQSLFEELQSKQCSKQ